MANSDEVKQSKQAPSIADDRKRKIAADCWKRGSEAMLKHNWDYAINMFRQAVNLAPDNLMYRQSLRGCEKKKYNDNGTGAAMAGMKLMGIRGKIKKARFQKDWVALESAAEDGLAVNPWDPTLNADAGEALRNLNCDEAAVFCYEHAVKGEPANKEYNRALGELLEDRGEYDRAMACFQRILEADPLDGEARSRISALQAKSVLDRGGYANASGTKEVRLGGDKPGAQADGPGMSVEQDLLRAIRKDEGNKDNYLRLADYYKRNGELEKAEEQLKIALQVSGGDINIREMVEDVQLDRMRQAVGLAKDTEAKSPDDPLLKKKSEDMRKELVARELEIFARRVERYPADMKIKFELAQRFFETRRHQEAIPLFQQARSDPRLKGEALLFLGKCFIADKEYALSKRQFLQAKDDIGFDEKPDKFKDLHYWLGRVCEQLDEKEEAIQAYQEVLAVDYNYRDVRKRLTGLESG